MKLFITLSRKSIAVILAAVIITVFLAGQVFSLRSGGLDGSTNAKRMQYLEGLGYSVEETPLSVKDIMIPEVFSDVYGKYNLLQKRAGFDLSLHKGKGAQVYTYKLDDKTNVNIIVSDGEIIGGDVCETAADGEMKPLYERK